MRTHQSAKVRGGRPGRAASRRTVPVRNPAVSARMSAKPSATASAGAGGPAAVRDLTPGTPYTWNVHARDADERLSRLSDPVTVRTATPAHSTCRVSYRLAGGWGNGFSADVNVTNTGPVPLSGWTLAFSFPGAADESDTGFWNANVSRSGRTVVAAPVGWNGSPAANGGDSADFGFTGTTSGDCPAPTVFTLRGTVRTTS
jgi:cellulase/cellobiase CelA1